MVSPSYSSLFFVVLFGFSLATTPGGYSLSIAKANLYLAYSAYCPAANLESFNCVYCDDWKSLTGGTFTTVSVPQSGSNIQAYVGYDNNHIVYIVFRGTVSSSLENWYEDLDFSQTSYSIPGGGGEVHEGFLNSWDSVKSAVQSALTTVHSHITPSAYYFTGHSLGAALATFAALELGATSSVPSYYYGFGLPRVGNQAFASYFDSKFSGKAFRSVNYGDPVSHVPLEDMGFYHVAREIWYSEDATSYQECDANDGEDENCSDSLWLWDYSFGDHTNYLGYALSNGNC